MSGSTDKEKNQIVLINKYKIEIKIHLKNILIKYKSV